MKFVDAHTHLELFALKTVPIENARSKKDVISMIQSAADKPVIAWGWNEESLGENITKSDINGFPFPVVLIRIDGHVGVINDRVIEDFNLKPSQNFDVEKGYVFEELLRYLASSLKPKDMTKPLLQAQTGAISKGILEVHDFVDYSIARTYFMIREKGDLRLNVVLMPYYKDYERILELFDIYGEDKSIQLGWVKVFVDGSIGARTAYLKQNYCDRASRGNLLVSEERLISIVSELEKKGLRISMHAIGDGGIEAVLNSLETANVKLKGHRIEHAEMINADQVKRLNEMGVTLCLQPNFNVVFMRTYEKALGHERARCMNPLKMLDEMNADIIFGSDMMPFDPEIGLNYASGILGNDKALFYYGGWRI
ncbi:MAG: amidohydrolase family protein [Thermodesulfobacteriota bacterium]